MAYAFRPSSRDCANTGEAMPAAAIAAISRSFDVLIMVLLR
jgi:hypothetical protein